MIFWMIPSHPMGNPGLKWKLQRHLKLHDNDLKKCFFCPWRCVTEAEEENANHYRLHTGLAGPKCETCGTKFTSSRALKAHFCQFMNEKMTGLNVNTVILQHTILPVFGFTRKNV